MEQEFWQRRWHNDEIQFHQSQINPNLQHYFDQLTLAPGDEIFVPLCGKSLDMLWLAEQGVHVTGVELSIEACRDFFTENHLAFEESTTAHFTVFRGERIQLLAGDFFETTAAELANISAVYDRAALIALPADMRQRYVKHLLKILPVNSKQLLISATYDQNTMDGPPFSVDEAEVMRLYQDCGGIDKVVDEKFPLIPPHLQARGLAAASEQVYLITNGR